MNIETAKVQFTTAHQLQDAGRLAEARALYGSVVTSGHLIELALHNLGVIAEAEGDGERAKVFFASALALAPSMPQAASNLAILHRREGDHELAAAYYRRAVENHVRHSQVGATPELNDALGMSLRALGRYDEALHAHHTAATLAPSNVDYVVNVAITLREMNRFGDALPWYERALTMKPDHAEAHLSEGLCRLQMGDFERGFQKYEYRWHKVSPHREFLQPLWLGEGSIAGRSIHVYHEQGLGDTIQFARFIPLLAARGATVIFEVQPSLLPVLENMPGAAMVVPTGAAIPATDFQCPLMSLPLGLGVRLETLPAPERYIHAPDTSRVIWQARLGATKALRVGLVWSGNSAHSRDNIRSLPLDAFSALESTGIELVSLQKEVRDTDRPALDRLNMRDFSVSLRDFGDTAALVESVDLVIAVDTSVAHLAAALGRPVWLLLATEADWRWLHGRADSPWYPSMRIFRQHQPAQWGAAFEDVNTALRALLAARGEARRSAA